MHLRAKTLKGLKTTKPIHGFLGITTLTFKNAICSVGTLREIPDLSLFGANRLKAGHLLVLHCGRDR